MAKLIKQSDVKQVDSFGQVEKLMREYEEDRTFDLIECKWKKKAEYEKDEDSGKKELVGYIYEVTLVKEYEAE